MAFNVQCNQCWEYQSPLLEVVKNEMGNVDYAKSRVICTECGGHITTQTHFAKVSMYGIGQIKRAEGSKKAFAVECPKCQKKDQPVLAGDNVACPHCGSVHSHLNKPFLQTVKEFLNNKL
jgi:uncharacterized Zn finger protein